MAPNVATFIGHSECRFSTRRPAWVLRAFQETPVVGLEGQGAIYIYIYAIYSAGPDIYIEWVSKGGS